MVKNKTYGPLRALDIVGMAVPCTSSCLIHLFFHCVTWDLILPCCIVSKSFCGLPDQHCSHFSSQLNYYEREIEMMKKDFAKKKKEMEQAFKLEVSVLDLETLHVKSRGLQDQLQSTIHSPELERKLELERVEMEQCYTQAPSGLTQRLAQEKDQLEELHRRHQHELQPFRSSVMPFQDFMSRVSCQN